MLKDQGFFWGGRGAPVWIEGQKLLVQESLCFPFYLPSSSQLLLLLLLLIIIICKLWLVVSFDYFIDSFNMHS